MKTSTLKCTVDAAELKSAMLLLLGVVEKKNTIPVLAQIRVDADKDRGTVTLTASDLDRYLICELAAKVSRSGNLLVAGRMLAQIADAAPLGPIEIEQSDQSVTLTQGELVYGMFVMVVDSFVQVPQFRAMPLKMKGADLRALFGHTKFAITQEEGRYTLSGVKFIADSSGVTVIATDGHRLAFARVNGGSKLRTPADVLIPRRTLNLMIEISRKDDDVRLGFNDDYLFVKAGSVRIVSRLLKGQFPDWQLVIPKNPIRFVEADSKEMAGVFERIAIMADEQSRYIKIAFEDTQMSISAENAYKGSAKCVVPISGEGESQTYAFNEQYLQDVVSRFSGPVVFKLTEPNAQVEIRPTGHGLAECFHIIMPMKL